MVLLEAGSLINIWFKYTEFSVREFAWILVKYVSAKGYLKKLQ